MKLSRLVPARLGAALVLVLGGVGTTLLTSAAPASADGCYPAQHSYLVTPGVNIQAWYNVFCPAYPATIGLPISVYQDGVLVVKDWGWAVYTCQGSTVRAYSIDFYGVPTVDFDAACG